MSKRTIRLVIANLEDTARVLANLQERHGDALAELRGESRAMNAKDKVIYAVNTIDLQVRHLKRMLGEG